MCTHTRPLPHTYTYTHTHLHTHTHTHTHIHTLSYLTIHLRTCTQMFTPFLPLVICHTHKPYLPSLPTPFTCSHYDELLTASTKMMKNDELPPIISSLDCTLNSPISPLIHLWLPEYFSVSLFLSLSFITTCITGGAFPQPPLLRAAVIGCV